MKTLSFLLLIAAWGTTFGITQINISPKGSDSAGDGSAAKPFGSLERACKAVESSADKEFEIIVNAGEYFFDKGISLGEKEFKGKKISIVGKPDAKGKPRFIGGKKISAKELSKVTDQSILSKLPKEAEGTLYSIDLKKYGISDYGKMRQRGFGSPKSSTQMEVVLDNSILKLAQYPNDETRIPIGKVLDKGFQKAVASGQGAYKPDNTGEVRGATFMYELPRADRWANAPDAYISGYPSAGWAYDEIKIKKLDPVAKTIQLESPHVYGVYSNTLPPWKRGDPAVSDAYLDVCIRGYKVINLIEELDVDGEYYIDRENGIFYIILKDRPSAETPLYFSVIERPFIKLSKVDNFSIKNIDMLSARNYALIADNCSDLLVDNCSVKACGRAVAVNGNTLSKRNKISNCRFSDNAFDVLTFCGGDRKTLERADSEIVNCTFENNARTIPCFSPAVSLAGVGIKLANCEFSNHPSMTVYHNGNDLLIEKNIFSRCCINSSDMGVIYTGRDPSMQGNVIRYNFFTDVVAPHPDAMVCGVYVDDGSVGQLIEKNIFCKTGNMRGDVGFGAIFIHAGADNMVSKNVFIDCQTGVGQTEWTDEKYADIIARNSYRFYKHVDVKSDVYKKRYPKLEKQLTADYPRMVFIENCKYWNSSVAVCGLLKMKKNGMLKLDKNVSKADAFKMESWSLSDVKRFFGSDKLVAEILKSSIGVKGKN